MKKIFIVTFVVMMFMVFTTLSYAETPKSAQVKLDTIKGVIVSIDSANNQIVVKEKNSGALKTFVLGQKAIASLKAGEHVKVKVNHGSNRAESIKVIKSRKVKK